MGVYDIWYVVQYHVGLHGIWYVVQQYMGVYCMVNGIVVHGGVCYCT